MLFDISRLKKAKFITMLLNRLPPAPDRQKVTRKEVQTQLDTGCTLYATLVLSGNILDLTDYIKLPGANAVLKPFFKNIRFCINVDLKELNPQFNNLPLSSLFYKAIIKGNCRLLQACLHAGLDVNGSLYENNGMTRMNPIVLAAAEGHLDAVKLLVQYGADLTSSFDTMEPYCNVAQVAALESGHQAIFDYLVSLERTATQPFIFPVLDDEGYTLLMHYAGIQEIEYMETLIHWGYLGDINAKDADGYSALTHALLLNDSYSPSIHPTTNGINPDAEREACIIAKKLIAQGADVHVVDIKGQGLLEISRVNHALLEAIPEFAALNSNSNAANSLAGSAAITTFGLFATNASNQEGHATQSHESTFVH